MKNELTRLKFVPAKASKSTRLPRLSFASFKFKCCGVLVILKSFHQKLRIKLFGNWLLLRWLVKTHVSIQMMTVLGTFLLVVCSRWVLVGDWWSRGKTWGGWVGEAHSGGAIGAGKADKTVSVETAGWLLLVFLSRPKILSQLLRRH